MNSVKAIFKNKTDMIIKAEQIANGEISQDIIGLLKCPECGAPAFYKKGKKQPHFGAYHKPECSVPKENSKVKKHKISTSIHVDDDSILNYKDIDPVVQPEGGNNHGGGNKTDITDIDSDNEDFATTFGIKKVGTAKGLLEYIEEVGYHECVLAGKTGDELMLRQEAIDNIRNYGMPNGVYGAILTRFPPNELDRAINYKGDYILFKDKYTYDKDKAIFFIVTMDNKAQFEKFKNLVFGMKHDRKGTRAKEKYIIIFAKWERIKDENHIVYKAKINSHSYCFRSDYD